MAEKKIDAGAIQIEDPLDFLSPAEKKEYIRAHQDTLLRSEEEMRRIREATEDAAEDDADYEEEDLFEMEDLYEDEDAYEEDAYEERSAGKPYVYQDTRLHTDERRQRAAKTESRAKTVKPSKPSKPAKPARQRVTYAAEAAEVFEDDEVEDTALDFMLSVAMKAFLAAILIVALIMAYMVYVRPLIRRTAGLSDQAAGGHTEDTIGMGLEAATPQETGGQETPQQEPANGETVVTTTQLNLRTAPNTETSEVVRTVPEGTRLTRLSDDGEWSKITIEGQELFCASAYLEAE